MTNKTFFSGSGLAALLLISLFQVKAQKTNAVNQISRNSIPLHRLLEEKFVLINGIEQWVTIDGDSTKPVILFLHGGPGSPISPYSDNLYTELKKDFIIVQWDQRGTGRTFGKNAPDELTPEFLQANLLTVDQIVKDGIELSAYLIKKLGKKKIILFGTSWGTVPGVKMATQRPDLYYAYVGHSQIVTPDDDLELYNRVYQLAKQNNDQPSLQTLDSVGVPPYDRARNTGKLYRVVKKYEMANAAPAPTAWFIEASQYDNAKDNQNRADGDDYSFVNFVGDKRLGVPSMRAGINLMRDNPAFNLPVYFIQGEKDLLTPKEKTNQYFKSLNAPQKEYYLLPDAAHGFNPSVLEMQVKIFMTIKTS